MCQYCCVFIYVWWVAFWMSGSVFCSQTKWVSVTTFTGLKMIRRQNEKFLIHLDAFILNLQCICAQYNLLWRNQHGYPEVDYLCSRMYCGEKQMLCYFCNMQTVNTFAKGKNTEPHLLACVAWDEQVFCVLDFFVLFLYPMLLYCFSDFFCLQFAPIISHLYFSSAFLRCFSHSVSISFCFHQQCI